MSKNIISKVCLLKSFFVSYNLKGECLNKTVELSFFKKRVSSNTWGYVKFDFLFWSTLLSWALVLPHSLLLIIVIVTAI